MLSFSQKIESKKFYFTDTSFNLLMQKRINHVLLVCSKYDSFMLEEDGRIDEQIFNEYVSLNLRYPPIFIQVNTPEEAFEVLRRENIDLVITMFSTGKMDAFELANKIKGTYPNLPTVVLTQISREVSVRLDREDVGAIDYVFSWLGNTDLLVAIIKLIEDRMNARYDIDKVGVQAILLVEDSIRFYSSYLPNIYKIILKQAKTYMSEGLNEHQKMLRMRGRPKILLASNYEEAIDIYEKYSHNLLGVISDIRYPRDGKVDPEAGIRLCEKIKADDKHMPFLLQSSDGKMRKRADELHVGFINKHSKTLSLELRNYILEHFGFGDFLFKVPDQKTPVARATDLQALQQKILEVPDDCLKYHIQRNDFSKWLNARALFPLAEMFRPLRPDDFINVEEVRTFIFDTIAGFRKDKGRGVIAKFDRRSFDEYLIFSRIGEGSIGGKARGLAFIDSLIKRNRIFDKYENVLITIPRTVVLCTDIFAEFMETNNLFRIGLSNLSDDEILRHFVNAQLPFRVHEDLKSFVSVARNPIAVRSSSLLEDSHYQPFAGVYSTYMIPKVENDIGKMMEMLTNAIKCVYASVFFNESKAYMTATSNVIDEEKMGIVLQEVSGTRYVNRFYPAISGVARSLNFYPIAPEKSNDGIANIAFGLGKSIVEGGISLRFSPKYPKNILQLSSPDMALRDTQKYFYALDLNPESFKISTDDGVNLIRMKIDDALPDGSLRHVASTYDYENNMIRDGAFTSGKKIVTFSNILNHQVFPLADILQNLLQIGQAEMNNPIEIEFAVNIDRPTGLPKLFHFLQIRPIVENMEEVNFDLNKVEREDTIISSLAALGNGKIKEISDVIYIRSETFNPAENPEIALKLEKINEKMIQESRFYVLIGPGRWGSSDPWLGIPVKWPQISAARLIVESGLENYRIDPSQGTHFFHNLTAFRVGYFTVNPYMNDGFFDKAFLDQCPAVYEDKQIRHVHFEVPLEIRIDGKRNMGVVMKPFIQQGSASAKI